MSVDYKAKIYYGVITDHDTLVTQYDHLEKIYKELESSGEDTSEVEVALDFLDCYCHIINSWDIDSNVIIGVGIVGSGAGESCHLDLFDLQEEAIEVDDWLVSCIAKYFPNIKDKPDFIMTCMVD